MKISQFFPASTFCIYNLHAAFVSRITEEEDILSSMFERSIYAASRPPLVLALCASLTIIATSFSPSSVVSHNQNNIRRPGPLSPHVFFAASPNGAAENDRYFIERVKNIRDWSEDVERSPLVKKTHPSPLALRLNVPPEWFVEDDAAVAAKVDVVVDATGGVAGATPAKSAAFVLAGPRAEVAFDPVAVKAAIVTCGGLCPGLNTVVRELVMCLRRQYGVRDVYGVPGGYRGFQKPEKWMPLTSSSVADAHNRGGTMLGSSRGGHDTDSIVDSLQEKGISLLFVVGGDGTVRGAMKVAQEIERRKLPIAVAVVPKTIDNDVPLLDRTFGFETAVEAARKAINVAHVEADGFPMGLGVVKVMGRRSGFIAMHSTLGSRVVDLCLVPEVPFFLEGPGGVVEHLASRLRKNGKAVVVVAEGAGQELLEKTEERDASGNLLLTDVGPWLCQRLKSLLDDEFASDPEATDAVTCKYIDPSYMIRGVPANTADNVMCTRLAHNAVHGAFAGLSSFLVGVVNTRSCYVPLRMVVDKRNVIDTKHQSLWEYVVFDTGQPAFEYNDACEISDDGTITASGGCISSSS